MGPLRAFWRDLAIAYKGLIVVAIPVLPLVATGLLYVEFDRAVARSQDETQRAWTARTLALQLYPLALEAESAARGYLLSGDRAQLDRTSTTRTQAGATLDALGRATDETVPRERLRRLRELVSARFDALDTLLASGRRSGTSSPEMQQELERGSALMNQLRDETSAIVDRNAEVLAGRQQRVERLRAQTSAVVLIGSFAGVVGGIIGALIFTASIARRLSFATGNVLRLADGQPIIPAAPSADEIGTLKAATARASDLLRRHEREITHRVQELEALTGELEAFTYSVSHDLRAPLRHVAGFASMLAKSADASLTDQQRRYIRTIVDAAARMGRLIDDLLAFSRTSRVELRRQPVDMGSIVADVRQQLAGEVDGRDIRWTVHPLPSVPGDPAMLRVVFDNLLSNAVKYSRGRSPAVIEVGTAAAERGETVLYVRDNGVGFDMQYQHKLFGVFQRLHSSDDFEGTGIGLATVRRIVARHGGRTWADARPGDGATFFVALPLEDSPA
jgi:signal transduction histidine kinase